jgi:hypothetical protein
MAQIFKQKMTAEIDGEFVVFLIGARIKPRFGLAKAARHLAVFAARDSARGRMAAPVAASR